MWGLSVIVIAGVTGALANSAVIAASGGAPFRETATNWGRYGVAIACAVYLPVAYISIPPPGGDLTGLIALWLTPSLLAKLVFSNPAPWPHVLGLNLIYALVTWSVYSLLV